MNMLCVCIGEWWCPSIVGVGSRGLACWLLTGLCLEGVRGVVGGVSVVVGRGGLFYE